MNLWYAMAFLPLHQSFYATIVDLEIIAIKFLGLALLAVRTCLSFLAFAPFTERRKELVSSHPSQ